MERLAQLTPAWYKPVLILENIWVWSEFIVMMTNKKRRALHDFLAGTLVIVKDGAQQGVPADQPRPTGSAGG